MQDKCEQTEVNQPDKRDHIERRWVVRIAQEVHESMNNRGSDLRESDCAHMDRLDEKLPIFWCLDEWSIADLTRMIEPITFSKSCS